MFINGKNSCFITLKDHKPNFLNNAKTRLLNPAKTELRRISKIILDKINLNLPNATKVNQRKNSNDVISEFKTIKNKQNFKFIIRMLKLFWDKNTNYRRWQKNNISFEKIATIWQRKHVYQERRGSIWCTMGAYDGAEICELVGTFLLEKSVKFVIKVILDYIGMTVYQFLETTLVLN